MSDKQLNDTDRKQLLAEAHFLRGFYHMQILLNWEKIIIRDKYITSTSQLSKAPSERVDAWDFVIAELKAGTELSSTRVNEQVGRATSGAAYAYLGYAYLTMAAEQADKKTEYLNEAVKAFDNVKGYSLESDFASMFNGSNKNCKESIFEIQFTLSTANGANYSTQMHPDLHHEGETDLCHHQTLLLNLYWHLHCEREQADAGESVYHRRP